jgi:hypothetical protein
MRQEEEEEVLQQARQTEGMVAMVQKQEVPEAQAREPEEGEQMVMAAPMPQQDQRPEVAVADGEKVLALQKRVRPDV